MAQGITKALSGSTVTRSHVDWLTTTTRGEDRSQPLWDLGQRILTAEEHKGQLPARRHLHGYAGFGTTHCFLGARADGCYLRISGEQCAEHWFEALTAAENCTRLDLAVDTALDPPVASLSQQLYRKSVHRFEHGGRPPMRKLVQDTNGGSTVYFGSRASERMGRVYDKGRETRTAAAGHWWRWEVELKDNSAEACGRAMLSAADASQFTLGVACRFFLSRSGFAPAKNTSAEVFNLPQEAPTAERLLQWLASGVRPTVARLVNHYGRDRVLHALGIPLSSAVDDPAPSDETRGAPWPPQPARFTR